MASQYTKSSRYLLLRHEPSLLRLRDMEQIHWTPPERVRKWRKQQQRKNNALLNGAISLSSTFVASLFTAPLGAVKLMAISNDYGLHKLSILNLYRGYITSIIKFGPRHAIEHTMYAMLSKQMHHVIAGALSACLSVMTLHPLDRIHVRTVLGKPPCMQHAFKGILPSIVQSSTNGIIWYSVLEAMKPHIHNSFALCGMCAIACVLITHPLDVIKTTCITKNLTGSEAVKLLIATRRMYRGFRVALLTSIPSITISYGTYVLMSKHFM